MLPVKKIRILMQKDYKQRKKLHIKKRQGVPYTAFSINASLTLEAALVLPVFLAALVAVVFFFTGDTSPVKTTTKSLQSGEKSIRICLLYEYCRYVGTGRTDYAG